MPLQAHYSTRLEEHFITLGHLDWNNTNTNYYKLLYNFNLFYLLISYIDIVIVLLYNVPIAIYYGWNALTPYTSSVW
jgi:hypothetical protein